MISTANMGACRIFCRVANLGTIAPTFFNCCMQITIPSWLNAFVHFDRTGRPAANMLLLQLSDGTDIWTDTQTDTRALHRPCSAPYVSIIDHICQQSKHTFSSCVHCTSVETPSTSAGQHQTPTCTPSPSARTANSRHTHPFNGPFSMTTRVSRYQKGKTNLDFTEARDSEWQWHQLGHMHVCKSVPHTRQITTPATHQSVFYRPDALPDAQPTVSKHWRQTAERNSL